MYCKQQLLGAVTVTLTVIISTQIVHPCDRLVIEM